MSDNTELTDIIGIIRLTLCEFYFNLQYVNI